LRRIPRPRTIAAMPAPVPVVHSPGYACDIGMHVFPVAKYAAVFAALVASRACRSEDRHEPPPPTRDLLAAAHDAEYLDDLEALRLTPRTAYSEMRLAPEVLAAFALGASGTTLAARLALEHGAAAHVGGGLHHAFADHAEGFCYFNDLAIAVRVLQREGRVRRVAVVDLDVHQGNGTAAIFADDATVFTLSVHQEHNYPVPKMRSTLDVGLDDGTGDDAYLAALAPALARVWAFAPELVLYQAGADPYADDQLGGLRLTREGLEARDRAVITGCRERDIPVVTTLGGGYARRFEDTVAIHATTSRLALAAAAGRSAR
jgi:acetoin utilization deacetylase AcuC-like enzyme